MLAELEMSKNKYEMSHNQKIINEIIEDWDCTELEAEASLAFDTVTLEETRDTIAQHVTYNRLMKALPLENERFLREEYYKDKPEAEDDEFIKSEAKEMAEELAWDVLYDVSLADDYDEISEPEKERVMYEEASS